MICVVGCASVNTRYYRAVTGGDVSTANNALDAGADVNHKEDYTTRPLERAIENNDVAMIEAILKRRPADFHLNLGLAAAMKRGNLAIAKTLVAAGADPVYSIGEVCSSDFPITPELIDFALPIGKQIDPASGGSALIYAIDKGQAPLAVRLIANGAETGFSDSIRERVICRALYKNASDEIFAAILKSKADLKITEYCRQDAYGDRTPLSWAKAMGRPKLSAMLKAAGGLEGDKSKRRETIDDYANVSMSTSASKTAPASPTATTPGSCSITHVSTNASGGGKCYTVDKVDGRPYAYDHRCSSKTASTEMRAKIVAACASGGKESDFLKQGLRVPHKGEL